MLNTMWHEKKYPPNSIHNSNYMSNKLCKDSFNIVYKFAICLKLIISIVTFATYICLWHENMKNKGYNETQIFLLKKGLLIQKEELSIKLFEIEQLLKELDEDFNYYSDETINDFKGNNSTNTTTIRNKIYHKINGRYISDKTFSGKIETILSEANIELTSRQILNEIYLKYSKINVNNDRKNMTMVSNILNQGFKKKKYSKDKRGEFYTYSLQ